MHQYGSFSVVSRSSHKKILRDSYCPTVKCLVLQLFPKQSKVLLVILILQYSTVCGLLGRLQKQGLKIFWRSHIRTVRMHSERSEVRAFPLKNSFWLFDHAAFITRMHAWSLHSELLSSSCNHNDLTACVSTNTNRRRRLRKAMISTAIGHSTSKYTQ